MAICICLEFISFFIVSNQNTDPTFRNLYLTRGHCLLLRCSGERENCFWQHVLEYNDPRVTGSSITICTEVMN